MGLDYIRGYLSFKEMHATRRVATDWADISEVHKLVELDPVHQYDLYWTYEGIPPPNASFLNVKHLSVNFEDPEDALLPLIEDRTMRVLQQSPGLQFLRIYGAPPQLVLESVSN